MRDSRGKRKGERRVARRADATDSLIISIAYANLRGETGLDAIRGNYFTLAKWLLLVAEPRVVSHSSAHTVHTRCGQRGRRTRSGEAEERYRTERGEANAWIAWCVPGRAWLAAHRVSRNQRSMSLIPVSLAGRCVMQKPINPLC